MGRSLAGVLLLLLLVAPVTAAERDPDYDRVLDAYKTKRWAEFDARAAKFVAEKPDYEHTHSVRYMIAESYRLRRRPDAAVAAYEAYVEQHEGAKYAIRCRQRIVQVLNRENRHAEALVRADRYLPAAKAAGLADALAYDRALALEGLRRFDEAVAAYRTVGGSNTEKAAHRIGVALFRGRKFEASAAALRAFLAKWPASALEGSARDYLLRADAPWKKIERGVIHDYEGKYEGDPRLAEIRKSLPELRGKALVRIREVVGTAPPDTALIRLADAGSSRSGNFASTRLEVVGGEPRQVLVLFTEYLVTGSFDLPSTLTHELYHALQRERLGEAHYTTPKWVREGTAVYVAGQEQARIRTLAAETGRRTNVRNPMERLVNGLGGRHGFDDYAEDVAAFAAVRERCGKEKLSALLRKLLETPDTEAAIRETLDEDFVTFERHAAEYARKTLAPLLAGGRDGVLDASRLIGAGKPDEALKALPEKPGVYAPAVVYIKAKAHLSAARPQRALTVIREEYYPAHRTFTPLTDNAILIEVKALKALAHPDYRRIAEQAKKDLEPTSAYRALRKVIE